MDVNAIGIGTDEQNTCLLQDLVETGIFFLGQV